MRNITLKADGLKICGELYFPEDKKAPYSTVCICHGIPAKRFDPADRGYAELAERVSRSGLAAVIFNFRGAGLSEGNLDLPGWTHDLKAVLDYLYALPQIDKARLLLLGFSAGAAVAVCVAAADKRVAAVAACACPAEFNFMGSEPQPTIQYFRRLNLIRDKDFPPSPQEWFEGFQSVRPAECVGGIAPRPLLLVHGSQDDTVPVAQAHQLYERAGNPKKLVIVDGVGHRLRQDERAMTVTIDWLKSTALK